MSQPASDETVAKLQLNFNCNLIQFLKGEFGDCKKIYPVVFNFGYDCMTYCLVHCERLTRRLKQFCNVYLFFPVVDCGLVGWGPPSGVNG